MWVWWHWYLINHWHTYENENRKGDWYNILMLLRLMKGFEGRETTVTKLSFVDRNSSVPGSQVLASADFVIVAGPTWCLECSQRLGWMWRLLLRVASRVDFRESCLNTVQVFAYWKLKAVVKRSLEHLKRHIAVWFRSLGLNFWLLSWCLPKWQRRQWQTIPMGGVHWEPVAGNI